MLVIPDDNAGEETDAWKLEVPCPNFITQGCFTTPGCGLQYQTNHRLKRRQTNEHPGPYVCLQDYEASAWNRIDSPHATLLVDSKPNRVTNPCCLTL
jgi:hypothetical protein